MCGLAGFVDIHRRLANPETLLSAMADSLAHRGPDDQGIWFDSQQGVGLAHRRLAIVDLSQEGHQPMRCAQGRYVIAYNGEIYNHRALRRELPSHPPLRGHSDTEVLLAAISHWGLEQTLEKLVGMFAFALWDRHQSTLSLVRDRLGIKPLYYGFWQGTLMFGSELKALRCDEQFPGDVHQGALATFLRYRYIPGQQSIHPGIWRLLPGTLLRFRPGHDHPPGRQHRYWCLQTLAQNARNQPFTGSPREAVEELGRLLDQAVAARMVADVPVGAFLSGGIDSSAVVASMQRQSTRSVKTFTIGRHHLRDESPYAQEVARRLGTEHTALHISGDHAAAMLPQIAHLYDEPFGDSSQIPSYLVSQLARQQVVVCLSGDGGDELFGGYRRYQQTADLWRPMGWLKPGLRRHLGTLLERVPVGLWDTLLWPLSSLLPRSQRHRLKGHRLHTLGELLHHETADALYQRLLAAGEPDDFLRDNSPILPLVTDSPIGGNGQLIPQLMMVDLLSYLPDDILTKLDRASMGVGLEARVPMLDHRLVEFALRLPLSIKIREGKGKWPLRQLLYPDLPMSLVDRPKRGFAVAIDQWLQGPLRDWAEAQLSPARLQNEGFFNTGIIRERWQEHLCGAKNWSPLLWSVLMFQAWLEAQRTPPTRGRAPPPPEARHPVAAR